MDIQPRYINLAELFERRLFRIPQYQRVYSWQTKHRGDLFDDIWRSYLSNGNSHFMATIVGLRRDTRTIITDEYQVIEIVDGQQRITTLILLLKAIARVLDHSQHQVEKRVRSDIEELLVKPDQASLLLLQTNHDTSGYFADYLRKGNYHNHRTARRLADWELLKAIEECSHFVNEWRTRGYSPTDLIVHLKNKLTFILHEIDDEGLVYSVFEVLNSRGLGVSWFDRLKSMLMAVVFEAETGNKDELIDEVHQLWSDIYGTVGLRSNLSNESLRFAGTLWSDSCPSRSLTEEDAVKLLLDKCKKDASKVIETTKWIKAVTEVVDGLTADRRTNAVTKIAHARLVAAAIQLRPDLTKNEKTRIMHGWENVTFRIFGMFRRDARTGVGDYVRLAWRIVREEITTDQIMNDLSEIGRHYPVDEALRQLEKSNCYEAWKEELLYFLFRYEEHLAREVGQTFNNEQWNRIWESSVADSIEHILPQSTEEEIVHWLGNLMILPPRLNSKLSDRKPRDKAEAYRDTGLRIACDVADRLIQSSQWLEANIIERERELIRWASEEWAD